MVNEIREQRSNIYLNVVICINSLDPFRNKREEFDAMFFDPWGSFAVEENTTGSFLNELQRYAVVLCVHLML